jgi:hypothetical protein
MREWVGTRAFARGINNDELFEVVESPKNKKMACSIIYHESN